LNFDDKLLKKIIKVNPTILIKVLIVNEVVTRAT
jgi:hypothetical protein